jgi:PAS domain S-box-containing protein
VSKLRQKLKCRQELRRILGVANYQHLIALIAYIKTCHVWMEAHPEVVYQADQRVQQNLGALLEDEPDLAEFFRDYKHKVKRECQSRAEQLVELTERRRQEEILRQQAERERLLAGMAQRIRQSLNLEEILNTTVSEVRQFLQTERVFIYRFEPDWSGYVAVESVAFDWSSLLGKKVKDSFFGSADGRRFYIQGRLQAAEDIYTAGLSKCHIDLLSRLEIRANLVVPIVQGEELWGLLVANQCSSPRQWQQLEIDLLQQLATQVAIAIQQSTLFEQVQSELSERKRSEQKIREQAALLDIASDAINVQDLDNQILFWNSQAERLYGWHKSEACGQNVNQLLYKESNTQLQQIQQLVLEKGSWQGELEQLTKSGKKIVVSSRWTLVCDEQGQPKSILVVNTDMTEKKQLEAQFLRSQRLESIGTLASGIAHDLNNALGPILMIAELLQEKILDFGTQQLLVELEASAKRGASLVKQVLSFARGVEGKRTVVQAKHILSELNQIIRQTFPKSIKIYTDISPNLWTICADATQLHQLLMNLVVNARDAMPSGGTLSIHAQNLFIDEHYAQMNLEAKVGPYIAIVVSDTGCGIAPEILERIFEPFFTTKEVGKGTGLGLSTVIGIIKSHGGFVNVYSEPGSGSQFKVYLPAVEGTQNQLIENLEMPKGNSQLILVVDDELSLREITKISLESNNYKVLTASDGIEAIALYAQYKTEISAVLMDMMMPEMDGLRTIRTLQKINPQLKIIATSGLASNDRMSEAAGVGVKAFLSKPYTVPTLLKTLSSVLNNV